MGGGCIRARVGPDCSPGTAAAPHFTPCVQKYLFPFSGGQETLGGLLSERPLVVSMWEEAGLGSKQGGRGQGCREGGLGAKQRAEEVGEGGRNAEREEELQVDKTSERSTGSDAGHCAASTHPNCFVFGRCPRACQDG